MKQKSKDRDLLQSGDSWKMLITVIWALAHKLEIYRPNDRQYQIEGWNFWPDKGTIQCDDKPAHRLRGLEGLAELLKIPLALARPETTVSARALVAGSNFTKPRATPLSTSMISAPRARQSRTAREFTAPSVILLNRPEPQNAQEPTEAPTFSLQVELVTDSAATQEQKPADFGPFTIEHPRVR